MERNKDPQAAIVQAYENQRALYGDFRREMERLVGGLVRRRGLPIVSVSSRLKDAESLRTKLRRMPGRYLELQDVTDLVGVRVITYFGDHVDAIAEVIEREFDVDKSDSVDKRQVLEADRFGYVSVHYVVALPADRLALTEYRTFHGCQAEIQIRSILQHAWAEIEHDLGYKTKDAVPDAYRRHFARLAGMFELADDEFVRLRDSLREYEKAVPERIRATPETVPIDLASLRWYVTTDEQIEKMDRRLAQAFGAGKAQIVSEDAALERYASALVEMGVYTIFDVQRCAGRYGDDAAELGYRFYAGNDPSPAESPRVSAGISLWWLALYLAASTGSREALQECHYLGIREMRSIHAYNWFADRLFYLYSSMHETDPDAQDG